MARDSVTWFSRRYERTPLKHVRYGTTNNNRISSLSRVAYSEQMLMFRGLIGVVSFNKIYHKHHETKYIAPSLLKVKRFCCLEIVSSQLRMSLVRFFHKGLKSIFKQILTL